MKIYIGYDSKIPIASKVCEFSLRHHSKEDLDITLLKTPALRKKNYIGDLIKINRHNLLTHDS